MKPICLLPTLPTWLTLLPLMCTAAPAPAAEATGNALARCRLLPEAAARLACYDALPLPLSLGLPAAPQAAAKPDAGSTSTAAPALTAAAVAITPESAFGLESRRTAVQDISSTLPGLFEGWDSNSRFKLANGQVWQVTDGTTASHYLRSPKVTVRRAALGSFRLEIEGVNQAPRVQRVE